MDVNEEEAAEEAEGEKRFVERHISTPKNT